jgi:hypothetical protein
MPIASADLLDAMWENGRDSLRHALDHFSERERSRQRWHHDKWIILSVHHAAECVSNVHLLEIDPNNKAFSGRDGFWFPSLSKAIKALQEAQNAGRLSIVERQLFVLLGRLPELRNQLMHRTLPDELDVSTAAICMMGLLKYVERKRGESSQDIVWQSPPIESDVLAAIRYTRLEEYAQFVEPFLREKYPDRTLPQCPNCGVAAVAGSKCEACFQQLGHISCSQCEEPIYFPDFPGGKELLPSSCPSCGARIDEN